MTDSKQLSKDLQDVIVESRKSSANESQKIVESSKLITLDEIIRQSSSIVDMNLQADLGAKEGSYYNDNFCDKSAVVP